MPIPALKHHIVLVSGQAVPSVLGASLPGKEPSHIHAIVTPTMRPAAYLTRKALDARGCLASFTEYELSDNANQHAIYRVLENIRAACVGDSLGVNITGGTKLMALAASEWAYASGVPAFYIDTAGELAILIARPWQYANLPDVLTVRDLLAANGFDMERRDTSPVPEERRNVLSRLLNFTSTPKGERALGNLNRLAEKASRADLCVRDDGPADTAWKELLRLCGEAGTLQIGADHVAFPDEEARRWCNGVWFEEYIKMTLYRLKAEKRLKDWATSVTVCRGGVKNEIDGLFAVRNRLFTIECKTSAMRSNAVQQTEKALAEKTTGVLYKADSLHDRLGGIFARAMLCSIRPLTDVDRERAKQLGIRVVCGRELQLLPDKISKWIKDV